MKKALFLSLLSLMLGMIVYSLFVSILNKDIQETSNKLRVTTPIDFVVNSLESKDKIQDSNIITLTPNNHTALNSAVNAQSIAAVFSLIERSDVTKPFYLYIYSPGGEVMAGLPLIEQMKNYPNVICISEFAASMAFAITQACPVRTVLSTSVLMQHQVSNRIQGEASKLKTGTVITEKLLVLMNMFQSKRLGISIEEFNKNIHDEWWMIGGNEILQNKAADKIVNVKCSRELSNLNKCPLVKFYK